jgi:hypothetical protein
VLAEAKDRDRVGLVDPPAFGSPVRLVWVKRRWQRTRRPAEAHLRTANEVPDHPGR